jgi:hypothetical protein
MIDSIPKLKFGIERQKVYHGDEKGCRAGYIVDAGYVLREAFEGVCGCKWSKTLQWMFVL